MILYFSAKTWAVTLGVLVVCATAAAPLAHAQTVHVTDDTNINLASPNQVNGAIASLFVRNIGAGGTRHTFLQFDLSTLRGRRTGFLAALVMYRALESPARSR